MNHDWETVMLSFRALTGLSEVDIVDKVQSLPCSYIQCMDFYARYGRFPTYNEGKILTMDGFGTLLDMIVLNNNSNHAKQ